MDYFRSLVPEEYLDVSGSVYYSGRRAFSGRRDVYFLGLNPGGSPVRQAAETVRWHCDLVLTEHPDCWSAYRDEAWTKATPGELRQPGTAPLQRRVLYLADRIGRPIEEVPSSNLIFRRSSRKATLEGNFSDQVKKCWTFHQAVINELRVTLIVCFGGDAGRFVRLQLNATKELARFTERNARRWSSRLHLGDGGVKIATLTHPSIADWIASQSDPTHLAVQALSE